MERVRREIVGSLPRQQLLSRNDSSVESVEVMTRFLFSSLGL